MTVIDSLLAGTDYYGFDIRDEKSMVAVFAKENPDVVFHLAGPINLRRPVNDPLFLRDLDFLDRVRSIFDTCRIYHVKKVIFVSSGGAIYQDAIKVPTPEDYLAHPASLYGLANLAIETYAKQFGIDVIIARLANVYGPGQWISGFVPAMIARVLKNEPPVIHGDGRQTRDFVYVQDVAEALIDVAQNGRSQTYNVGSGQETSLNDIFGMIKNMASSDLDPVYRPLHAPETKRSCLDITKIQKEIGWQPKVSLKEGLQKTIEFYAAKKP